MKKPRRLYVLTSLLLGLGLILAHGIAGGTVSAQSFPSDDTESQSTPTSPDGTASEGGLDEETEIEAPKLNAEDLAKKTQNPISDLISLPFQDNLSFGLGPEDREQNVIHLQRLLHVKL